MYRAGWMWDLVRFLCAILSIMSIVDVVPCNDIWYSCNEMDTRKVWVRLGLEVCFHV